MLDYIGDMLSLAGRPRAQPILKRHVSPPNPAFDTGPNWDCAALS